MHGYKSWPAATNWNFLVWRKSGSCFEWTNTWMDDSQIRGIAGFNFESSSFPWYISMICCMINIKCKVLCIWYLHLFKEPSTSADMRNEDLDKNKWKMTFQPNPLKQVQEVVSSQKMSEFKHPSNWFKKSAAKKIRTSYALHSFLSCAMQKWKFIPYTLH